MRRRIRPEVTYQNLIFQKGPILDVDSRQNNICEFCVMNRPRVPLIKYCECLNRFHHDCLLTYICKKIQKMRNQVILTDIKCMKCHIPFKIDYSEPLKLTCKYYCRRVSDNYCDKILVSIIVLPIVFIVLLLLGLFYYFRRNPLNVQSLVGIVLFVLAGLVLFLLLFIVGYLVFKYLLITEIVLNRVLEWGEVGDSNSSGERNITLPDYFEVRINT